MRAKKFLLDSLLMFLSGLREGECAECEAKQDGKAYGEVSWHHAEKCTTRREPLTARGSFLIGPLGFCEESAIDPDGLSADEGCSFTGQKNHGWGDISGGPNATQRSQ